MKELIKISREGDLSVAALTFAVRASHASLSARWSSLSVWARLMAVNRGMMGRRCSLKDTRNVWNTWGGGVENILSATLVRSQVSVIIIGLLL